MCVSTNIYTRIFCNGCALCPVHMLFYIQAALSPPRRSSGKARIKLASSIMRKRKCFSRRSHLITLTFKMYLEMMYFTIQKHF